MNKIIILIIGFYFLFFMKKTRSSEHQLGKENRFKLQQKTSIWFAVYHIWQYRNR